MIIFLVVISDEWDRIKLRYLYTRKREKKINIQNNARFAASFVMIFAAFNNILWIREKILLR